MNDSKPVVTQDSISFSWEGELFMGDFESLWKTYKNRRPAKKFRIWLIDLGYKIYSQDSLTSQN